MHVYWGEVNSVEFLSQLGLIELEYNNWHLVITHLPFSEIGIFHLQRVGSSAIHLLFLCCKDFHFSIFLSLSKVFRIEENELGFFIFFFFFLYIEWEYQMVLRMGLCSLGLKHLIETDLNLCNGVFLPCTCTYFGRISVLLSLSLSHFKVLDLSG